MIALLGVSQHLVLGLAGPVLPTDKSLILLLGDGYIAGYFVGSVFLPDAADLHEPPSPSSPLADAEVEIWRRRWGIAIATVFAVIWVIGEIRTPHAFTLASSDHDLFGAIPLVGVGALLGAISAPFIAKRLLRISTRNLSRIGTEHRMGQRYERVFATVLASVYVGVWLNPW
ncbi:MAG TPA: hypothetical protein VNB59_01770 [Solirubrobacterales bacterium]|nr:hypothetical protein [Solirubrobacterales bacterium]